ncbi:methyl-accepting chemotaxis protein [Clostridium weizhouense]|uniref:Methyl-accepting chemotaxis protein n=1 Tax=Clostridium weizhouense TaxID=2859781 RepID=A0ABS7APX1_9CLOT|nr:methyl-accepting chemotaxis protein [Clostridium weizhouense]MBW6410708.1 methyl-accepting chemotaxis protein [Clostridium weizhouense]
MMGFKRWSLVKKTVTFTTIILLLYSLILGAVTSIKTKNNIQQEFNKNIVNTLNVITANIDGDKLEELIKKGKEYNGYYDELHQYLKDAKEKSDFRFLYTIGKFKDNNFYYLVEGLDENSEEFTGYGEQVEVTEDEEINYKDENEALKKGSYVTDIEYYEEWGYLITANVAIYNSKNEPVAILAADLNANEYNSTLDKTTYFIIANLIFGGILIAIFIGIYLFKALKPMKKIENAVSSIAKGNLNVSLDVKSEDEIGKISKAMNDMGSNLNNIVSNITNNSKNVFIYSNDLQEQSEQFTSSAKQVVEKTGEIAEFSEIQYDKIQLIVDKAKSINSEVENIINKLEKVASEIETSHSHAEQGENIIKNSTDKIITANNSMEVSKEKILELDKKINDIINFVEVITNISDQTNLLALNASIESSRAGEAGKGFSVVAEEVRKLADESSKATKEINTILKDINLSSKEVFSSIDKTYNDLKQGTSSSKEAEKYFVNILASSNNVKNNTSEVLKSIDNYSKETEDILVAVKDADDSIEKLSKSCESISKISEEQFASSEEILRYASELKMVSEKLDESIKVFNIHS